MALPKNGFNHWTRHEHDIHHQQISGKATIHSGDAINCGFHYGDVHAGRLCQQTLPSMFYILSAIHWNAALHTLEGHPHSVNSSSLLASRQGGRVGSERQHRQPSLVTCLDDFSENALAKELLYFMCRSS